MNVEFDLETLGFQILPVSTESNRKSTGGETETVSRKPAWEADYPCFLVVGEAGPAQTRGNSGAGNLTGNRAETLLRIRQFEKGSRCQPSLLLEAILDFRHRASGQPHSRVMA